MQTGPSAGSNQPGQTMPGQEARRFACAFLELVRSYGRFPLPSFSLLGHPHHPCQGAPRGCYANEGRWAQVKTRLAERLTEHELT